MLQICLAAESASLQKINELIYENDPQQIPHRCRARRGACLAGQRARSAAVPAQTIGKYCGAHLAGIGLTAPCRRRNVLPADAPNILIVLIDDAGPGQCDTYGGLIHTPTLTRIAQEGISYNRFHTTAMC